MLWQQILSRPKEYELCTHLSPKTAAKEMRLAALEHMPKRLMKKWKGGWTSKQIPYFYVFQKAGCYPEGALTCTKDHAHVREIFATCPRPLPVQRVIGFAAKGFRIIVKWFRKQAARLWSMAQFGTELQSKVRLLKSMPGCVDMCMRCNAAKQPLVGVRGDANSYYKRITEERIVTAAKFLCSTITKHTGLSSVTLLRKKKWHGFIGGTLAAISRDRYIVSFEELIQTLLFELKYGTLGCVCGVVIRLKYAPMGGKLSEVLCSLVAVHYEVMAAKGWKDLVRCHFIPQIATNLQEWIMSLGHVDDLLSISRVLCVDCLTLFQQRLLPEEVGYGVKGSGWCFRFLQAVLIFRGHDVMSIPFNPNAPFALGEDQNQAVARIRPVLGFADWSQANLRSYIRQKLATNRQATGGGSEEERETMLSGADWLIATELHRLGYSWRSLNKVWAALQPAKSDKSTYQVRQWIRRTLKSEICCVSPTSPSSPSSRG